MVTIDNVIVNVGTFSGDLKTERRDYERAKQGAARIKDELALLEDAIKAETEYDNLHLPHEAMLTGFEVGDVTFEVRSDRRMKRPKYKSAVSEMENYLSGISFLQSRGRTITGVAKEGKSVYISVDKLLEDYGVIVAGVMSPEVKHTISYVAAGLDTPPQEIELTGSHDLNEANAANYVRMNMLKPVLKQFVKDYEAALAKEEEDGITQVNTRAGYKTTTTQSDGVDWGYVVKSIIAVPTHPDELGELNYLADQEMSKAEKERQFPTYRLNYREVRGSTQLFISIGSVYQRIQELKQGKTIEAERTKVQHVDLV
ncbi:MAG: hypothetical protein KJ709_01230 [Nanoarchaeota archaeon]|nr:hypothetical protein [Nanoarchaeota archaeon]